MDDRRLAIDRGPSPRIPPSDTHGPYENRTPARAGPAPGVGADMTDVALSSGLRSSDDSRRGVGLVLVSLLWFGLVVGGFSWLWDYAGTPGEAASAPEQWPASSSLAREPGRPTLAVFLHPRCTCSSATMAELRRLLHDARIRPTVSLVFAEPDGRALDPETSATFAEARTLAGVRVVEDPRGEEARRFGAATSGQVVLYDADGRLAFAGGITPARAHEGDSRGRAALLELLGGHAPASDLTSVYGCPLDDPEPRGVVP